MPNKNITKAAKALGSIGGSKRSPKKKEAVLQNLKKAIETKRQKKQQQSL